MTDVSMKVSDRKALISLITCAASVLGALALVLTISFFDGWPLVLKGIDAVAGALGTVLFFVVNILDLVALPITIALFLVLMLSVCLSVKGFEEHPGDGAAAWRVWLNKYFGAGLALTFTSFLFLGLLSLFSFIPGGDESLVVYSSLMTMERGELVEQDSDRYWRRQLHRLGEKGTYSTKALRSTCVGLVRSTPAGTPYVLTVNGRTAGPGSCGWGINSLTWSSK